MRLTSLPHHTGHDREGQAFLSVLSEVTVSGGAADASNDRVLYLQSPAVAKSFDVAKVLSHPGRIIVGNWFPNNPTWVAQFSNQHSRPGVHPDDLCQAVCV